MGNFTKMWLSYGFLLACFSVSTLISGPLSWFFIAVELCCFAPIIYFGRAGTREV